MRALAGCVALALLMTGCGSPDYGPAKTLDWDLATSHTMNDVDWPDPSAEFVELRPIASLTIALSDGRQVNETSAIRRIDIERIKQQVTELDIFAEPATVDEAYERALRWCKAYKLDIPALEEWHAGAGQKYGTVTKGAGTTVGSPDPSIAINASDSFDPDRPVIMALVLFWPTDLSVFDG
jgi:hypothetical protein